MTTTMKTTYHVVTSADGTIFAIFGAKLPYAATLKAKAMSNPGATFYVDTVSKTKKPIIGGKLF